MAVSANVFESAIAQAFAGNIKWEASGGDTIKMALLTSAAAPSLSSWQHYSDLTNEVVAGNGYSTGGVALASPTVTSTAANSWGTAWAASTARAVGDIVIPSTANGFLYVCVAAGTTGTTAPTFPTVVGETVVDNTVTWANLGESITVFSSAAASWTAPAGDTLSAAYAVIYDSQSGTGTTEPLISLVNFGQTLSATGANLTVTPSAVGGWFFTTPN